VSDSCELNPDLACGVDSEALLSWEERRRGPEGRFPGIFDRRPNMAKRFKQSDWDKIHKLAKKSANTLGLPVRRKNSVVLGTFNICEFGTRKSRPDPAWDFLEMTCKRFDLMAVQEVGDNLEAIRYLKERLGKKYGMVVSDVTGVYPGDRGNAERLAFLFRWDRIQRTELASDVTHDRTKVVKTLVDHRDDFVVSWDAFEDAREAWEEAQAPDWLGDEVPPEPALTVPRFLTFIRQPHCASFQIKPRGEAESVEFLGVNAHLLYGEDAEERKQEFDALIHWLMIRAKKKEYLYHKNLLMMGDCNLELKSAEAKRKEIDDDLKALNKKVLKSKKAAKVNFPLLTPHPKHGELKTNARQDQTYDQIAIFAHDKRLPTSDDNKKAGTGGKDAYDYGVFRFTDLFARAIHDGDFKDLSESKQKDLFARSKADVSDHMPAWFRLPVPGAD